MVKKEGKKAKRLQKPTVVKDKKGAGRKRVKKPSAARALVKAEENPIISPKPENEWEASQTFNPGVILLKGKIHFLYRAVGKDGISRFGYASSNDGFFIDERLSYPVYEHQIKQRSFNIFSYFSGGSWGGAEDPRIVRINGEDRLCMTYTACDQGLRVAFTSIKVDDFLNKKWRWKPPILLSPPGEVHKNWVIFPEKIKGKYAILHSISPEILIDYFDSLDFDETTHIDSFHDNAPRKNCWDKWLRGVGPVPVKTKDGWLVFYHAMDDDWSKYKVGAMLLDLDEPTKILARSKGPVLEPREI